MKKLDEVAKVVAGVAVKPDLAGVWVKSVGTFEVLNTFPSKSDPKHFIVIIPNNEVLLDYIFHILKRPIHNLNKEDAKVLKKLALKTVKEIELPIPSIEQQKKILKSKNIERRFQRFWLENGLRDYDEPLKVDMSFDELLKLMLTSPPTPKKK